MAALRTLKESGFRLVCATGLLGPEIGNGVLAFLAACPDFGMGFYLLNNFNLFIALHGFFQFQTSFLFRFFGEAAGTIKNALRSFLFGP